MFENYLDFKFEQEQPRRQRFFSEQDDYYYYRKHIYEFAEKICKYLEQNPSLKVLEVGASSKLHKETNLSEFDTGIIGQCCIDNVIYYKTLDVDSNSSADYIGSIENLDFLYPIQEKFDVIIMLSVIEHVEQFWKVPFELWEHTTKNSKLFVNSPFLFKIHGPSPDSWRISEEGYKILFKNYFDITYIDTFPENELGKNSFPLSLNLILEKCQ